MSLSSSAVTFFAPNSPTFSPQEDLSVPACNALWLRRCLYLRKHFCVLLTFFFCAFITIYWCHMLCACNCLMNCASGFNIFTVYALEFLYLSLCRRQFLYLFNYLSSYFNYPDASLFIPNKCCYR